MGHEQMSQAALDRAYQLRVTRTSGEVVLFEVLYPRGRASARPAHSQRSRVVDIGRLVPTLRAKYKIPTPNIFYVGFSDEELQRGFGRVPIGVRRYEKDTAPVDGN